MEDKECCKWCGWCLNLKDNKGICDLDIGCHIENTEEHCCFAYYFDDDLERC